jgi:hypothetical protein
MIGQTKGGARVLQTPRSAWQPLLKKGTAMSTVSRPSPNGQSSVRSSRTDEPHGHARLELVINGQSFRVRPTQVGTLGEFRSWRLREVSGATHIVSQELDGFTTCTCMDFVARRNPESHCKHILALLAVGLLDGKGGVA